MVIHISSRLTWHDMGWNGCICENPIHNVSCTIHDHVRQKKNSIFEQNTAGIPVQDAGFLPPCDRDIGAFSEKGYSMTHKDPLEWRKLPSIEENIPPYSWCTSPYGRMFATSGDYTWENDPAIQFEKLKEFWHPDLIKPNHSLVFFYVNHANPVKDEPGTRILVGIGRIKEIGDQLYFGKKSIDDPDHPIWSRRITQNPQQMVLFPYQDYLAKGHNVDNILCEIPEIARPAFSYVAEHVSNDIAVAIIEKAISSIQTVIDDGLVPGNWTASLKWLNIVLDECWKERGRYPGIGTILRYLGYDEGPFFHRIVLSPIMREGKDTWEFTRSILDNPELCKKQSYYKGMKLAAETWKQSGPTRQELLKTLAQFELTKAQLERVVNTSLRAKAEIVLSLDKPVSDQDIVENPYILCERDKGGWDDEIKDISLPISFEAIDHGMIPCGEAAKVKGHLAVIPNNDRRRVRALITKILKRKALEGDTVVSIDELVTKAASDIPGERKCIPDVELIKGNLFFNEECLKLGLDEQPYYAILDYLYEAEYKTEEIIKRLLKKRLPASGLDWKSVIKGIPNAIAEDADPDMVERALEGQSKALEKVFQSRISIIKGRAGTGKTTVVEALLRGIEQEGKGRIVLLAPTGKARVKLSGKTNRSAETIHQLLSRTNWLHKHIFELRHRGGEQESYSTVVIDEASMIPADLFYTLLNALVENDIRRLVLVGDPNQLPPIGPGKPFVDIISFLEQEQIIKTYGDRVANLNERVRHRHIHSEALRLADAFLGSAESAGDDEILSKVSSGKITGASDLEVIFWRDADQLYDILKNRLQENLMINPGDYITFNGSLGLNTQQNPYPEKWQILSPVRNYLHGITEINRRIQKEYRGGLLKHKKDSPKPFGEQQIVYQDKVIQIANGTIPFWNGSKEEKQYVANGDIGIVAGTKKATKKGYSDVAYMKYPSKGLDGVFKYYRGMVDQYLELAYAITVHKSQGSDFDYVFLIIPKDTAFLSRELLYTGLTRFKERMIVLVEKDDTAFLKCRNPKSSATFQRSTGLFGLKLYFQTDKPFMQQNLIHRTAKNILVRSKSEVVVANVLTKLGIDYKYEEKLVPEDNNPNDYRLPDFTVSFAGDVYLWEHLGMLSVPAYKKDWERKREWYKKHGYMIVGLGAEEGFKEPEVLPAKLVITSADGLNGSIDSLEIENLARKYILGEGL